MMLARTLCRSHRSVPPPPRIPLPKTILARRFPKPLGKKVSAQLGQTKRIRQSSVAERTPPGCVPPSLAGAGAGRGQGMEMGAAPRGEPSLPLQRITLG